MCFVNEETIVCDMYNVIGIVTAVGQSEPAWCKQVSDNVTIRRGL